MKLPAFVAFVAPSVLVMLLLIAVPLGGVVYLSLYTAHVKTEMVSVQTAVPLFGGQTRMQTSTVSRAVLDSSGHPQWEWQYVGGTRIVESADLAGIGRILARPHDGMSRLDAFGEIYRDITRNDFWGATEFTLLYTAITTPLVLGVGFLLALALNQAARWIRGTLIFATILPMVVTPLVGALAIYWLFLDDAIVPAALNAIGLGHVYFLQDALSIRSLIIFFGVWNAAPFAFIILYAGLQTVPQEMLDAAMVDGASRPQRVWLIIVPHLLPLFGVIAMIHMMDAFRVFEPILVFGSSVFANSLQYLTYHVIAYDDDPHRAACYAVLTVIGVILLLTPILIKTWRDQRVAAM